MNTENARRLLLLGRLKEALESKKPNINHCIGLVNALIALETEESDKQEERREEDWKNTLLLQKNHS